MSSSIFFSWQGDRPTNLCRNFIHRALEDAIQRLKTDVEVEEAIRNSLEVDTDTKKVPGSPEIFNTILSKISAASIFVADLTFVGARFDGRPLSNPNVLVEYGYALGEVKDSRIIAVMNSAFGAPTPASMPFNLGHRRFPITYELNEGATEEERKTVRKSLTQVLETALGMVFKSDEFKALGQPPRPPNALEVAAAHQAELNYKRKLRALRYDEGLVRVEESARTLIEAIEAKCRQISSTVTFPLDFGAEYRREETRTPWFGARASASLALHIVWEPPDPGSGDDGRINVREFEGRISLPGERITVIQRQPVAKSQSLYKPTLSREGDLGWVEAKWGSATLEFLSTDDLAEICVTRFLHMLPK